MPFLATSGFLTDVSCNRNGISNIFAGQMMWKLIYRFRGNRYTMDARLLDVIIGVICFCILIVLLGLLPRVMDAGTAYVSAILIFILALSGAGYLVNKKIA
jgi:hypothetical protein